MENEETKGDISRNIKTPNVESTSYGKIGEYPQKCVIKDIDLFDSQILVVKC
jgi:hypothetical protein